MRLTVLQHLPLNHSHREPRWIFLAGYPLLRGATSCYPFLVVALRCYIKGVSLRAAALPLIDQMGTQAGNVKMALMAAVLGLFLAIAAVEAIPRLLPGLMPR